MRFQGFVGPTYTNESVNLEAQRCVNLYPELDETGAGKDRNILALLRTPGLSLFSNISAIGAGVGRGSHVASNLRAFCVVANKLYEISSSGGVTSMGTLSTSSGLVSIADNGVQLAIVDGTYGYILTMGTNAFAQITDVDFPAATHIRFLDGYFVVNQKGTRNFFISSLYDGTAWDGLDFAAKEGLPDNITAIEVDHRDLFLIGERSSEVWRNTGAADFPLERNPSVFIEHGAGQFGGPTVQKLDNSLFWGGEDQNGANMVYRLVGYVPERISTHAIEQTIKNLGGFRNCESSFTYQDDGHSFYQLNFATVSLVYDVATQLWHERTYTSPVGSGETRHRANSHMFAFNKHLVQDWQTGDIYEMSKSVYTDNGAPISSRRRAPHVSKELKRLKHLSFQLDMETGVGLDVPATTGGVETLGYEPNAYLRWSNDGGHTWSNYHGAKLGKIGQYGARAKWNRLGIARDRVYEVLITDPVKVAIVGAILELAA